VRRATAWGLALALLPAAAHAQWQRWSTGTSSIYLQGVISPDGVHVFASGSDITTSGMLPSIRVRAQASEDNGRSFHEISGAMAAHAGLDSAGGSFFLDARTGWVASGRRVWHTEDAGAAWTSADAGFMALALRFFDAQNGVAAGESGTIKRTYDGGRTWNAVPSGTQIDLREMFWLDAKRGWSTGYTEDRDTWVVLQGVLLSTNDGGATWTEGASFAPGGGPGPVFVLCDGTTGFVAAHRTPEEDRYEAVLYKTLDGGRTLQEIPLPLAVGKLSVMGFTGDVQASIVRAMYWEDAQRGHLGGMAYLARESRSQSGGSSSATITTTYWAVVDYLTSDGGATWQKTDLGTRTASLTTPPAHDNYIGAGLLVDLYNGWMVGDTQSVWGYGRTCAADAECGAGYGCWRTRCVRQGGFGCLQPCPPGQERVGGECRTPGSGGSTGSGGTDGSTDEQEQLKFVGIDCGCTGGAAGAPAALSLLVLALRRRGRRTCERPEAPPSGRSSR